MNNTYLMESGDSEEDSNSSLGYVYTTSEDDSDDNKATKYKFKQSKDSLLKLQVNHLEPIAKILQEVVTGTTNFFSEDELCETNFQIKVEGVGWLTFPLTENRIQKLISVSTKALVIKNIRDTPHEISGKKLNVNIEQGRLFQMLETVRGEIGVSDSYYLEAQLDNMLIYSPGQLDFHQDSEKETDMIGTLVVIVPSPHIGGNLIIQQDTKEHIFVSENLASRSFKCISFYADCQQKIEKVRQGFRVALMYKLILKPGNNAPTSYVNRNLKDSIKNYFDTCRKNIFQSKFVYLLDHSYTEHSLKWNMLKGVDNQRGMSLLAVAKSLDLVPYLALVEIQYIWGNLHKYRHHCVSPIPIDLDYVNYHMLHFINSDNETQPYDDHWDAREKEICWTKETTTSFKHFRSYCEGFTGSGLSLDYWYKRGVIVLWPSSMKIKINFELNYEESLKELQAKIENPGKEKEVCEIVKKCKASLCARSKSGKKDFNILAEIALYIKDKEASKCILSHFKWDILNKESTDYDDMVNSVTLARRMAKLDLLYGSISCIDLLNKWKQTKKYIINVDLFIELFVHSGGSKEVVKMIINEQICHISSQSIQQNSTDEIEKHIIEIVCSIFVSFSLIESDEFVDNIMRYVISNTLIFTNRNLVVLYIMLKEKHDTSSETDVLGYCKPLQAYIETKLCIKIAKVGKTMKDWSINKQLNCQCKYCYEVNNFLLSKTEVGHRLKLLPRYREHIEYLWNSLDLPVSFIVSPRNGIEKLTLLKSETLLQDKAKKYAQLKCYLGQIL